jgi:hypothetical protein
MDESGRSLSQVLPRQVLEGWEKAWINTVDIPADIRTVYISNMSEALPLEPACLLEKLLKKAGWNREHDRFSSTGHMSFLNWTIS